MDASVPTHVVTRAFMGPGDRQLARGEKVSAEGWRNVRALESQRYLRPVGPLDMAPPAPRKGKE